MDSSSSASTTTTTTTTTNTTINTSTRSSASSSATNNTSGTASSSQNTTSSTNGSNDDKNNKTAASQESPDDSSKQQQAQNNNSKKKSTTKNVEMDLKSSIIEFMRARPFLWNSKHPNYKDHKRRDVEFQAFSRQINHSVQEIKRVWHVLRTNFFRAHKLLLERPHNNSGGSENGSGSEKLWKYYLAMEYILEGTQLALSDDSSSSKETRQKAKGGKTFRDLRGVRRQPSATDTSTASGTSVAPTSGDLVLYGGPSANSSMTAPIPMNHNNTSSNSIANHCNNNNDDDNLYARSLTSSLKRFDPTTQEVIKLKFQEIIVDYMQRQQQQQQQHHQYPPILHHNTQPQLIQQTQAIISSSHQQQKMQLNSNQSDLS